MKILVADTDQTSVDLMAFSLRQAGFQVLPARDGAAALRLWAGNHPDLLVLAVNLPGLDGLTVCRRIREQAHTPVVLLAEQARDDDIVRGLQLGADDYLAKPFSMRHLVARIQAVLRRVGQPPAPTQRRQVGDLVLDPYRRAVHLGQNKVVSLTPLECRLLDYLMLNAGRTLTTDAIIDHVWGVDGSDRDTLRQLVRRLRAKIEPNPAQPTYVETVPNLGYGLSLAAPGRAT